MLNFFILLAILLAIAFLVNYFLVRSFLGFRWRIFVAPGVILHELSHAFGCLITGAKIVNVSFFDKEGGQVKHRPSIIPILGPIIISLAPLAVGILAFYFLAQRVQLTNTLDLSSIYFNFKMILRSVDWHNWLNLIIIYLLLSTVVTMTPSWQDLRNMAIPVIIIAGIFYLLIRYISLDFQRFDVLFLPLSPILNIVIFILAIFLVLSFILFAFSKIMLKK